MIIKEFNCKWRESLIWNVSFTGVLKKTLKYVLKSMEKYEKNYSVEIIKKINNMK